MNKEYLIPGPESPDEVVDYYVEQGTAIRELELRMWHSIGKLLFDKVVIGEELKPIAQKMKKHVSELKAAFAFYGGYPDFEDFVFDKSTTWSKVKREFGTEEKRPRKSLKKIIEEHKIAHEVALNIGGEGINRNYVQGKLDEDTEILKEA